jgi:hypothetical protein
MPAKQSYGPNIGKLSVLLIGIGAMLISYHLQFYKLYTNSKFAQMELFFGVWKGNNYFVNRLIDHELRN